jgi:hypothetical protein
MLKRAAKMTLNILECTYGGNKSKKQHGILMEAKAKGL